MVGVSGAQYLINETLRRRIARGEAADVGFDSSVDFERLMALRPDLVMLFGIGGADTALTGKLRELEASPTLYMGEHCEESPLGKSEWVVVAAEIAGLRTEGSRLFAAIPERYERLRALAQQTAARPRV
ncbi:ABC transporter substrate-binding protein [Alistipes putredinis]|uniref:ABC transporter substrate-binding protein n=1 Tax=Alistipes putredinis TaxID=28117 RepID=UPI003992B020